MIIPEQYRQGPPGGVRLRGWEEVNVRKLAKGIGVVRHHLCDVLRGRSKGSMKLLSRVANALGSDMHSLLVMIGKARILEQERVNSKA
jgi:plasmid maintenance system antidote protein VapI